MPFLKSAAVLEHYTNFCFYYLVDFLRAVIFQTAEGAFDERLNAAHDGAHVLSYDSRGKEALLIFPT